MLVAESDGGGHLVVPVDFSEHQERLLAHAREVARTYEMRVTLVHVIDVENRPPCETQVDQDMVADRIWNGLERRAEEPEASGLNAEVEIQRGDVVEEILGVTEELTPTFLPRRPTDERDSIEC